jgi:RNA polymerase sigma-70 factor (ECF subfamily)
VSIAGWDWQALRHRSRLEASRYLRDPVAADDVAQEALLRAWRGRAACRTPDAPLPWVLAITRNEALRWQARAHHERESLVAAVTDGDGAPDPADAATERVWVGAAVQRLDAGDRRLVLLRYDSDLTTAQIAQRLGAPEGTVKIRLHRLRKRLRGELE